jgi:hypothetical protein
MGLSLRFPTHLVARAGQRFRLVHRRASFFRGVRLVPFQLVPPSIVSLTAGRARGDLVFRPI